MAFHMMTQPTTPPYDQFSLGGQSGHSRSVSASSSLYTLDSSPEYGEIALPTPTKSPIRQNGPLLLPKIRSQDQNMDPSVSSAARKPRKALSCTQNPPASMMSACRPDMFRRSTSPQGVFCDLISPVSIPSSMGSNMSSELSSPVSMVSSSHSRRHSGSQLDDQILGKYGFPTYRQLPAYMPPATFVSSTVPGASTFVPPPTFTARPYALPVDLQFNDAGPTTTMLDYLTGPNPTPALVRQINVNSGRGSGQTHFWWDIRNLRSWTDFDLNALDNVPDLMRLLSIELPETALPCPRVDRSRLQPETESALHDLCRDFYAAKVNAALKVSQGQTHMVMRAERGPADKGPHFVSAYQDDVEKTILGQGRGRVVGLVKSFDRWNTGMRAEAPHRKVEYLLGLAHLQRCMREHSCRYGFIMTEIELVCVRAGTDDIPYFGMLELAPTVQLKTTAADDSSSPSSSSSSSPSASASHSSHPTALTACLALWYLHMLAKEVPLPGQASWRTEIGGAAALTRHKFLSDKDDWVPEPQLGEKREAKRNRGWVMPGDPLHRREMPRSKRWHK
ncbi:MAG: hypothetical protein M1825_002230 [Sarcosagium campestre]|nr:MAG: hypothetical protein M1825_002230 [Sarcosagium campestre]